MYKIKNSEQDKTHTYAHTHMHVQMHTHAHTLTHTQIMTAPSFQFSLRYQKQAYKN